MSIPPPQTARLLFVYTYQQTVPDKPFDQNHLALARLCRTHLGLLDQRDGGTHLWRCYPDAVQQGSEMIEVSVHFIPRDNLISTFDARILWNNLEKIYMCEARRPDFGGRMIAMNMRPLYVNSAQARTTLTFGRLVDRISAAQPIKIDIEDVREFKGDFSAIGLHAFFSTVGNCARAIEAITTLVNSDNSGKETSSCVSTRDFCTLSNIAENAEKGRLWLGSFSNGNIPREKFYEITRQATFLQEQFKDFHRAAVAHVLDCFVTEFSSAERYIEAFQSVVKLQTAADYLAEGSKKLMSILENKRSVRNGSVLGTSIGGTATAVAACFLPPGIIAVGAAYAGVGLFSAGMTYYGMKRLEESPQSERVIQGHAEVKRLHQQLLFRMAACLSTDAWYFDLQNMPAAARKSFFETFDIHPDYVYSTDFAKASLKLTLDQLEKSHSRLIREMNGVLLDLGILNLDQPVARQAIQTSTIESEKTEAKSVEELEGMHIQSGTWCEKRLCLE